MATMDDPDLVAFPRSCRVSALNPMKSLGTGSTNDGCHGNKDGVDPNDKAILAHVSVMILLGWFLRGTSGCWR